MSHATAAAAGIAADRAAKTTISHDEAAVVVADARVMVFAFFFQALTALAAFLGTFFRDLPAVTVIVPTRARTMIIVAAAEDVLEDTTTRREKHHEPSNRQRNLRLHHGVLPVTAGVAKGERHCGLLSKRSTIGEFNLTDSVNFDDSADFFERTTFPNRFEDSKLRNPCLP